MSPEQSPSTTEPTIISEVPHFEAKTQDTVPTFETPEQPASNIGPENPVDDMKIKRLTVINPDGAVTVNHYDRNMGGLHGREIAEVEVQKAPVSGRLGLGQRVLQSLGIRKK